MCHFTNSLYSNKQLAYSYGAWVAFHKLGYCSKHLYSIWYPISPAPKQGC